VTDEVGDEAEVAVDLHWNFSVEATEKLCKALEPYDLAWIEDPLPPENADALATLNRSVDQPLLTGENRYGRHGFRDLVEKEAVSFVAPDIPKTGGIAETKKIAELADTYYLTMSPHNIRSPVATMAGVHLGATVPEFPRARSSTPATCRGGTTSLLATNHSSKTGISRFRTSRDSG